MICFLSPCSRVPDTLWLFGMALNCLLFVGARFIQRKVVQGKWNQSQDIRVSTFYDCLSSTKFQRPQNENIAKYLSLDLFFSIAFQFIFFYFYTRLHCFSFVFPWKNFYTVYQQITQSKFIFL